MSIGQEASSVAAMTINALWIRECWRRSNVIGVASRVLKIERRKRESEWLSLGCLARSGTRVSRI